MAWLKSKWQWLLVAVLVAIAFFMGKGVSADDIRTALAFRKLKEVDQEHRATEAKAAELDKKVDALATEILTEQVQLEAEKEKMKHAPPSAVDDFLREHGAIK